MAYTIRNSAENGGGGASSTLAVTLSGTNIVAGDLVVVAASCATAGTVSQISDGTTNLTLLTADSSGNDQCTIGYLLSTVATGLPTYTVTYSGSVSQRECHVYVFNPAGLSSSLDTEIHTGKNVSSTAVDSGAITTTGTDEVAVCFAYHDTATSMTAGTMKINSVINDGNLDPGGNQSSWYRILTSTFTGNGTATLPAGTQWMAPMAAFKTSGGGGGAAVPLLGQMCL